MAKKRKRSHRKPAPRRRARKSPPKQHAPGNLAAFTPLDLTKGLRVVMAPVILKGKPQIGMKVGKYISMTLLVAKQLGVDLKAAQLRAWYNAGRIVVKS